MASSVNNTNFICIKRYIKYYLYKKYNFPAELSNTLNEK